MQWHEIEKISNELFLEIYGAFIKVFEFRKLYCTFDFLFRFLKLVSKKLSKAPKNFFRTKALQSFSIFFFIFCNNCFNILRKLNESSSKAFLKYHKKILIIFLPSPFDKNFFKFYFLHFSHSIKCSIFVSTSAVMRLGSKETQTKQFYKHNAEVFD